MRRSRSSRRAERASPGADARRPARSPRARPHRGARDRVPGGSARRGFTRGRSRAVGARGVAPADPLALSRRVRGCGSARLPLHGGSGRERLALELTARRAHARSRRGGGRDPARARPRTRGRRGAARSRPDHLPRDGTRRAAARRRDPYRRAHGRLGQHRDHGRRDRGGQPRLHRRDPDRLRRGVPALVRERRAALHAAQPGVPVDRGADLREARIADPAFATPRFTRMAGFTRPTNCREAVEHRSA